MYDTISTPRFPASGSLRMPSAWLQVSSKRINIPTTRRGAWCRAREMKGVEQQGDFDGHLLGISSFVMECSWFLIGF
jgi:predicted RNA polymerase sigma factor